MILQLALRNLTGRPWRSVFLLFGYGVGVGVMIALLSIGEALITQARDEKLVGGGDITVLPEGIDIEVMKTGGVGGLFFSIDHARFVHRQLLTSPRIAEAVEAVAPQIDGKVMYLGTANGAQYPVRATGELPDATQEVGAAPALLAGAWTNDDGDRRFHAPTPHELRHELDHFHHLPTYADHPESWGEWHYFNVISDDRQRWVFISYIIGGDIRTRDQWGGRLAITTHDHLGTTRRYAANVPAKEVAFSTTSADLTIGSATVRVLDNGDYAVRGSAREEGGTGSITIDLVVTPTPRAYFPGASLGSREFVSGYVVPALRAEASGTICANNRCETYTNAQSYHDHNWGIWRDVSWDWGSARAGAFTILYGRVIPPATAGDPPSLFVYVVDSLGFRAMFRPREIRYVDSTTIRVNGQSVRVPSRAEFWDARGRDTLNVVLDIEQATGTDTRTPERDRGDQQGIGKVARPYFIQMKGTATLTGRIGGVPVHGSGTGFFETYR